MTPGPKSLTGTTMTHAERQARSIGTGKRGATPRLRAGLKMWLAAPSVHNDDRSRTACRRVNENSQETR
jgi:hypothetical protein